MEKFPWWNEAQIELAEDAKRFTDEVLIPIGERDALKKRFSWEGVKQMASKGWFGALIPKKYGGHAEEWGVTGAAIILHGLDHLPVELVRRWFVLKRSLDCTRLLRPNPECAENKLGENITIYGYLDRKGQAEMMNRAKLVVCRSGYTTVMELAELGKKALMIPTPGQTEQEYLGRYYAERGYYHCVSQYELDLAKDIEKARSLSGARCASRTQDNVEKLYKDLFAPVLD